MAVWALFGATAFCSWSFAINRAIIGWGDSPAKTLAQIGFGAALTAGAWVAWRRRERWMSFAAATLLLAFVAGEGRRAWLRESYGARVGGAQVVSLLQPVTTTDLAIDRYTVSSSRLPRERLRVVHLSDLHVNELLSPDYYAQVNAEVKALEPDMIVLTGDYISKAQRVGLLRQWLKELPRAADGTYAVLGNHDYWTDQPELVRAAFEQVGARVLTGECVAAAGGRVCGTDAPWGPGLKAAALAGNGGFTLVLSHTPDNVYEVAEGGADAMFAGHTHGGQIRLPLLGALIVPSRYGRRFDRGQFVVGPTSLFVSSGVGADSPAIRLWCRPTIVVVDFVRGR